MMSRSFEEVQREAENVKTTLTERVMASILWDTQGILSMQLIIQSFLKTE